MKEITLDVRLARAVAQILNERWTGVARSDAVCHAFSDIIMSATADRTRAEIALRCKIASKLETAVQMAQALVSVDVHDGVVEMRGIVPSESCRREICRLASQADQNLIVRDHLIYIDPESGAFLLSPDDSAADFNHPPIYNCAGH